MATPLAIERLGRVGSTQDEARLRHRGGPLLVTATSQYAARGRSGAVWVTADRAVAASLAFEPDWPTDAMARITLVAGLAVTDVLRLPIGLEWPNDIVVGDLKIGGILTESTDGLVVVGFGLNLFWESPPPGMGAVHASDPGEEYPHGIALRWVEALLGRIAAGPTHWGRDEYLTFCTTVGRSIEWEPAGSGVAVDVNDEGALLVDNGSGEIALYAGTVRGVSPQRRP